MMDFVATVTTYSTDTATKTVWSWFEPLVRETEGLTYYRAPLVGAAGEPIADLTIFSDRYQPIVIKVADWTLDEITEGENDQWIITRNGQTFHIPSPFIEIDEFRHRLQEKLDRERRIRGSFQVKGYVALPMVNAADFYVKFGGQQDLIWGNDDARSALKTISTHLSPDDFRLALSAVQGARPLNNRYAGPPPTIMVRISDAIHFLERNIAILDKEQIKVAHQVPPGPQRIRGLAGTGKTVLLAMKAANLHARHRDKHILYTFHTQSLYNHVRYLISQFYRDITQGLDPDWDLLHIRHAWGGKQKDGVYSDLCKRVNVQPITFLSARLIDSDSPFDACCKHALSLNPEPQYDFILIDEAQDFPSTFFSLSWVLCRPLLPDPTSRPIYWAYDELQTLSNLAIPDVIGQFGKNENGEPNVSLEGDPYPGEIEKDFILHRSYRCPHLTLMVAHGIGLGIKNSSGPVQMLADADSWRSIGYVVESDLTPGQDAILYRPEQNSPNPLSTLATPIQPLLKHLAFQDRYEELKWVAESIEDDIRKQGVRPEQILVISLDARRSRQDLLHLQTELTGRKIASTLPGLVEGSSEFMEAGRVTLATVFRAKGNEAPMVYIVAAEKLYDYVNEVGNRNKVFTAVSRSKGWVRITGVGQGMQRLGLEIENIQSDFPRFRFKFPEMGKIRKLDAETAFRKREFRRAKEAARNLNEVDVAAIVGLDEATQRSLIERSLRALLQGQGGDDPAIAGAANEILKKIAK
jgi:superfamily I DNA and RNA helicase